MNTEQIMCSGCGQMRTWRGMECLSTCPCLENQEPETVNNNPTPTESPYWLAEADKIIAADPEKYRDYHAMILRHAFERGQMDNNTAIKSLIAIKELIEKGEYSDEGVLEIIEEELKP